MERSRPTGESAYRRPSQFSVVRPEYSMSRVLASSLKWPPWEVFQPIVPSRATGAPSGEAEGNQSESSTPASTTSSTPASIIPTPFSSTPAWVGVGVDVDLATSPSGWMDRILETQHLDPGPGDVPPRQEEPAVHAHDRSAFGRGRREGASLGSARCSKERRAHRRFFRKRAYGAARPIRSRPRTEGTRNRSGSGNPASSGRGAGKSPGRNRSP